MLSKKIKEATMTGHQETEKRVVLRIKDIQSDADYVEILKCFYAHFKAVEQAIAPYINSVLPDYAERRNSSYIRNDIDELGGTIDHLPAAYAPKVGNPLEAMGALYVLEGSIMGGPYIVQMLEKKGINKGFSFFNGYGAESRQKWGAFTAVLDTLPKNEEESARAIEIATETFKKFGDVFEQA